MFSIKNYAINKININSSRIYTYMIASKFIANVFNKEL